MQRLDIYKNHKWGVLCLDGFDDEEAKVACRQLGMYGGLVIKSDFYKIGAADNIPLWGTALECTGNEASLNDCPGEWVNYYLGINSSECYSGSYAALYCSDTEVTDPPPIPTTTGVNNNCDTDNCDTNTSDVNSNQTFGPTEETAGAFQNNPELAFVLERAPIRLRGNTPYLGVVELFVEDSWSHICDSYWSDIDASVVCRQLGFQAGSAIGECSII